MGGTGIRMPLHRFAGTIRRNKHRDDRAHGRLQNPLAQNDVRAGEPSRRWEARWNKWKGHPAIAVLERIDRRDGNPWVIAGRKPGGHLTDLQHPWRRIRARAGLDDVRIHDLRHSFASGGLLVGEGLPMIGKLLGHTQVQTTARYAHLANDPVKSAANRIASRIAEVSG